MFLDRVLEQDPGFVGTESRLKLVIDTLDDLVVGASEDPEARLRHLREAQRRSGEFSLRLNRSNTKVRHRDIDRRKFANGLSQRSRCCVNCRATSARSKNRFARSLGSRQLRQ